jgi:hypothetical protein
LENHSASLPTLLHEIRQRQDAMRTVAAEMARLRNDVLAATNREAERVLITARAEVHAIIVRARETVRQLMTEASAVIQDDSLPLSTPSSAAPAQDTAAHLVGVEAGLRQLLAETLPELEALTQEVKTIGLVNGPLPAQFGNEPVIAADAANQRSTDAASKGAQELYTELELWNGRSDFQRRESDVK